MHIYIYIQYIHTQNTCVYIFIKRIVKCVQMCMCVVCNLTHLAHESAPMTKTCDKLWFKSLHRT